MTEHLGKQEVAYWISIVVLIATLAAGWGTLSQQVADICDRIERQEIKIERLEQNMKESNRDATRMQISLARIETDLAYVRTWIERQGGAP